MTVLNAIANGLRHGASLSGRMSRFDFWCFTGFLVALYAVASAAYGGAIRPAVGLELWLRATTASGAGLGFGINGFVHNSSNGLIWALVPVALYVMWIPAVVRRQHDIGHSATLALALMLVGPALLVLALLVVAAAHLLSVSAAPILPIIGLLALSSTVLTVAGPLILTIGLTRPSEPGTTEYGPYPDGALL